MTRRAVLVAAAAVALILVPGAAMAHSPSTANAAAVAGRPMARSGPNAGVPFTVRASGATANEAVTLTITRHPSLRGKPPRVLTKRANAKGAVEFVVTLIEDGTYTLVSTRANGSILGTQSVTVVDRGSVIVAGESAAAAAGGPTASKAAGAPSAGNAAGAELAFTGFEGLGLAAGGGVFVLAGAGLLLLARWRPVSATHRSPATK